MPLSANIYELLVQGVVDYAIFLLDTDGNVASWNPGAERIKGYTPSAILGRHFSLFYTDEDRRAGKPTRALRLASEDGRFADDGWRVRKDGTRFWATVVIDPIRQDGALVGFAKITRDLTERREAELQVEKAREHLMHAQRMEAVGQLTGGIAHDFNNLLTIIRSSIDLMQRPNVDDARRQRYQDAISEATKRAAKLTNQLLAFARRQALQPEVFDVARSIAALDDMVRTLTGPNIHVESPMSGVARFVTADPRQFDTAIINVVANARDAMDGLGALTITIAEAQDVPALRSRPRIHGAFVAISVTDTGSGILPEHAERIFEPFFTTKAVGMGTGLGLSQVLGFVQQSGGDIDVVSEPGKGTTFTLYLPRAADPGRPDAGGPEAASVLPAVTQGIRVLVVEDNETVAALTVHALEELGFDPVLAIDAEAALAELGSDATRFDVVFSDVIMPGMNGIDLAREITRRHAGLPVVLTSGYSDMLAQTGTGGFELLHKPYAIEQLSTVLSKAGHGRSERRTARP